MTEQNSDSTLLGEISHGPSALELFLEKNQKLLAAAAILLALAIAAFVVMRTIKNDQAQTAGALLSQASDEASLQKIITEFSSTPAAATAALSLANKLWDTGKQDEAIAALKNLITKNPESTSATTAQMNLAKYLQAQGKTEDAKAAYETVVSSNSFYAPAALIALGDLAKTNKDLKTAEQNYKKVRADFSDSVFAEEALSRINLLNFKAPAEIEPPPAPATPPAANEPPTSILSPEEPATTTPDPNANPLLKELDKPNQ